MLRAVLLFIVLLAGAHPVRAQIGGLGDALGGGSVQRPEQVVRWTAHVVEGTPGRPELRLDATVADGWKVYALDSPPPSPPLVVTPVLPPGVDAAGAAVHRTEPKTTFDPNFQATVRLFEHAVAVAVPLRGVTAGQRLGADVRFTTCNDRICLPPKVVRVEAVAPARLAESPATPAREPSVAEPSVEQPPVEDGVRPTPLASGSDTAVSSTARPDTAASSDTVAAAAADAPALPEPQRNESPFSFSFLLLAVGAGLAALLTPCVFPMLPLTVSFFARAAEGDRAKAVRQALLYGAAIVGTYTALGLLLALAVGAGGAGRIAANPWVNTLIGVLFVVFGLSLMGLFELSLPARWVNRVDGASRRASGAAGPLLMGLTLTLVAFSCTVPFVGALLAAAAQGAWLRPVVGMLVFSVTFAAPFVLLAMFPHALQRLPRAGSWMRTVAVTLGFVEIAAALKFWSSADLVWGWGVFTRPVVIVLTVALFVVAGLYLLGFVRMGEADEERPAVGVGRLAWGVAFLASALYLVPGLFGANLGVFDAYLPPRRATDFTLTAASETSHDAGWIVGQAGIAQALAEAKATGRPVVVDFTGYTCTNCRYMEANVFPQPAVAAAFERFVRLRLYTDDLEEGEALQRYQLETTGTVALPTYALLSPDGRLLAQHSGLASAEAFAAFLARAL